MDRTESPCVRNCCLNEADICSGCLRSLDEIKEWGKASEEAKKVILERIKSQKKSKSSPVSI